MPIRINSQNRVRNSWENRGLDGRLFMVACLAYGSLTVLTLGMLLALSLVFNRQRRKAHRLMVPNWSFRDCLTVCIHSHIQIIRQRLAAIWPSRK
jgi:hypothetical protein